MNILIITHQFAGRSSMKQYMPLKPTKRGFKVWVRADAITGYFCDFDVYVGRPSDGGSTQVGLGRGWYFSFADHYVEPTTRCS